MLPHTANAGETRFSLEVLAIDALSRHVREVTIFQLSNPSRSKTSDAASRFFSRYAPALEEKTLEDRINEVLVVD